MTVGHNLSLAKKAPSLSPFRARVLLSVGVYAVHLAHAVDSARDGRGSPSPAQAAEPSIGRFGSASDNTQQQLLKQESASISSQRRRRDTRRPYPDSGRIRSRYDCCDNIPQEKQMVIRLLSPGYSIPGRLECYGKTYSAFRIFNAAKKIGAANKQTPSEFVNTLVNVFRMSKKDAIYFLVSDPDSSDSYVEKVPIRDYLSSWDNHRYGGHNLTFDSDGDAYGHHKNCCCPCCKDEPQSHESSPWRSDYEQKVQPDSRTVPFHSQRCTCAHCYKRKNPEDLVSNASDNSMPSSQCDTLHSDSSGYLRQQTAAQD